MRSISYGLVSGGSALSVYGKQFTNRQDALMTGLTELKEMMAKVVGQKNTINFKQPIILATLNDIKKHRSTPYNLPCFNRAFFMDKP